jgi:uncharacterized protein (DUF362 family)
MTWLTDPLVAVSRDVPRYATRAPYHASESYPEWQGQIIGGEDNPSYRAVRRCFIELGLDSANSGTQAWNPLGGIVRRGDTVVLKPNLVCHRNTGERSYGLTDTDSLVTHGSVIRAVVDYVARALDRSGCIVIGDCPIQGARWDQIVALTGLDAIAAYAERAFPGIELRIEDFRLGRAEMAGDRMVGRTSEEWRPADYREVDLGRHSLLCPLMKDSYAFGVAQYPRHRMVRAHGPDRNAYLFPRTFLGADVFINLPKFKSHMKAGVTCAMKNLVGINGHKDYLPHFRFGSPKDGGDEYPDGNWLWDLMWRLMHADWELDSGRLKAVYHQAAMMCYRGLRYFYGCPRGYLSVGGGGWHGNDTLWRTVLDINRAFLYCDDSSDTPRPSRARRYFAILDGIVGGHRESPLSPTPFASGFMLAGANPVALDSVATALMGFDWRRIKQVREAWRVERFPLAAFQPNDVRVCGLPGVSSIDDIYGGYDYARFEPSVGFRGAVEYGGDSRGSTPVPDRWAMQFAGSEEVGADTR